MTKNVNKYNMMKSFEFYFLQALFFIVYLPLITMVLHFALMEAGIKNNIFHGILYFAIFGLICIYNTRIFPLLSRKAKYIIVLLPIVLIAIMVVYALHVNII